MTTSSELIDIEIAYALPDKQTVIALRVPRGTTAIEAVRQSRIAERFPGLDIENAAMGIFSQVLGSRGMPRPRDYAVKAGDRIEIYRPLVADPKEIRRRRVAKARPKNATSN